MARPLDDLVEDRVDRRLNLALDVGLAVLGITRAKGTSAEHHCAVCREIQIGDRPTLEPHAAQLTLLESGEPQDRRVFVVRGSVLGAVRQQEEGLHEEQG